MKQFFMIVCLLEIIYFRVGFSVEQENYTTNTLKPSCYSKIYCESEFLNDVQLSHIYSDSKTFVDKKLKYSESQIILKYNELKKKYNGKIPPKPELTKFIDKHLEDGDELELWTPPDFTERPSIANQVKDQSYKRWAYELNQVWKILARKVKDDVRTQPERYSLIWVPNGFFIPGGRFRELYYWDTYWIVNGLMLCDMKTTARGVIDNIISLVRSNGFMPNGARVYYLNRTQTPMLILMVSSYYKATNDFEYVKKVIPDLVKEFQYWMKYRMITFEKDGKSYTMARYYAPSRGPRPESYKEDYELAETFNTEEEKNDFYVKIKSGAESGWDFSSRWFITPDGLESGNLTDIETLNIIPVDLNSILHVNAQTLSNWFELMGNREESEEYSKIAQNFLDGIQEVLWRADRGVWFDWDLINHKHRDYFYVSNIVPLWTKSYNMPKEEVADGVLKYLIDQNIIEPDYSIKYPGGIPTSLSQSSQQWDFPNAWPPLQAFIIQGLDRTQHKPAQDIAEKLADLWLRTNYKGFSKKSIMFEKYDVTAPGETGDGGEYSPQTGFGWTNGIVFEFLNRWNYLDYNPSN